ncbi:serine/threonine-protein kinase [Streptosporangium sp. NPDC049644]|uniref:serine/threonine protein kinase n=1 Tax=Streptosporangium sp. NPDC049644 TaxID=3155507 RepID=UPI003435F0AF
MTGVTPPVPGDPAEVGPYRIIGRLGHGGQGTVYLAGSPAGARVAVKVLGRSNATDQTLARFNREIELARRVKAFCTAQLLEHGEVSGTPYIVSEYVDGPSLARVIGERGPLRGAELRRLAIGTLTALAAIHRAGVVHRDFKPANVLFARDGPRVIDFGISRALDAKATLSDHLVGTPPYMAPEQFDGRDSGPPADLFAWASTMVCAATGEPPFGSDALPAVIHRILTAEPRLGSLDDGLRELVGECLAKNPQARPTATQALLRLLGHRVESQPREIGDDVLGEGRARAATPPARRRPVRLVAAALAALALTAGVAVHLTRGDGATETASRREPRPDISITPTRPATGPMAATSTTGLRIPGTTITLRENPSDTERVTSYQDSRKNTTAYLRRGNGADFTFLGTFATAVLAPGGAHVAVNPDNKFLTGEFDLIRVVDPAGGQDVQIRTVDTPLKTLNPHWDGNGTRILLTIYEGLEEQRSRGFVIVDVASRTARVSLVPGDGLDSEYVWGPDSASVVHAGPGGSVLFHRLDGTVLRTVPKVGELTRDDVRTTSLGTVFTTRCPGESRDVCLWDAATAARRAAVPIRNGVRFGGWLGDRHFLATMPGRTTKIVMLDLRGEIVRVLADGPATELEKVVLWYTAR